jgi:hypothetical protein
MSNPYDVTEYGFKYDCFTERERLYAWCECIGVESDLEGGSLADKAARSDRAWTAWESLFCVVCGCKLHSFEITKGYKSDGYCVDCYYDYEENNK